MEQRAPKRRALDALTAAALTLPGLSSHAAGTEVEFGYSHYAESERENYGQRARYQPISVDSSTLRANTRLYDRVTLRFGYAEDTWSGATPMSTAPQAGEPNRGTFPGMPLSGASPFLESNFYVDQQLQPYRFAVTPDGGFAQQLHLHCLHGAKVAEQAFYVLDQFGWRFQYLAVLEPLAEIPQALESFFFRAGAHQ